MSMEPLHSLQRVPSGLKSMAGAFDFARSANRSHLSVVRSNISAAERVTVVAATGMPISRAGPSRETLADDIVSLN